MAEKREKPANESQSQLSWSGGFGTGLAGLGQFLGDNVIGDVAAAAALELAAHRAIGAFRILAPAADRGADVAIANHIA